MKGSFQLETNQIKSNVDKLQKFMKSEGLDYFYISSFDPYLSEYVPMENCHRYYISGFDGSVAEALVPVNGKVKLYVDGRYYEQADLQTDPSIIDVVKVPGNSSLSSELFQDLSKLKPNLMGIEADRTPYNYFSEFTKRTKLKKYVHNELEKVIDFQKMGTPSPITELHVDYKNLSVHEKLKKIFPDMESAYFIAAIDSIAWLTNCRSYQLPHLSSFMSRALILPHHIHVFIPSNAKFNGGEIDGVSFYNLEESQIENKITEIYAKNDIQKLFYDPSMLNTKDYAMIEKVFGEKKLTAKPGGIVEFHSIKDKKEIEIIKSAFENGDKAIFNTIKWVKDSIKNGKKITERDLFDQTTIEYKRQGALEQSFRTIAGVGANGSIIHYGAASDKVIIQKKDLVLLDSGGYFESGYATDTTRAFMASTEEGVDPLFKKIYTLVLKGTLRTQNAVFKTGTKGCVLDGLAREAMYRFGYDYNHGTGHGVGVHVHEGGVRLSSLSVVPMKEGQVCSIEPGIYLPGIGGVRLENICYVEKHPEYEDFLRFKPLVYIGFDHDLIDMNLMNDDEKKWLLSYEEECKKRSRSFLV
jgi:Xaa-Pro aminopeptidase